MPSDEGEDAWKKAAAPPRPVRAGRRAAMLGMLALRLAARKP
jgi:hypothetical protein